MSEPVEILPPEIEVALAYTPAGLRDALRVMFGLDQRLGRIVAATSEPMLGQMRLAWWRDMLGTYVDQRPSGDAVLDAVAMHWSGNEASLVQAVDGWEILVASETIGAGELDRVASGRAAPFVTLFGCDAPEDAERVRAAATRFAFADIASRLSEEGERETAVERGLMVEGPAIRLPREARGLAVLEALSVRAMKRGGRPLLDGRGASLTALRVGIFGA